MILVTDTRNFAAVDTNTIYLLQFQLFLQRYRAAAKAEIAGSDDEEEIDEDFEAHAGLEWVEGVTVETEGSDGLTEEEIKKSVRKGRFHIWFAYLTKKKNTMTVLNSPNFLQQIC